MTLPSFPPQLTLYYSPKACSLASHIALEESGLPYTAAAVNIRAQDHRRPEYLKLNPSGTVPALGIDDQVLTESQAILTYIADLVPERNLLPRTGTLARARAHQWMNLVSSTVHVAFRGIFRPQTYGGEAPEGVAAVGAQSHQNLAKAIQTIEQRLADRPYALGEEFSVADAYLFVFYLWSHDERIQHELPERPHWRALAERVWQRASVRKVVAREREVRAYDLPPGFASETGTARAAA